MKKLTRRKPATGRSFAAAIAAVRPFPESEMLRILIKVNDAFAALAGGSDDCDLFDRLAACLNVGLVRSESIGNGRPAELTFIAAQAALREADDLYGRHGRYGFTGPGLVAMREAIVLYEDILRASTPQQMHDAQMECVARMRAGHVHTPTPANYPAGSAPSSVAP